MKNKKWTKKEERELLKLIQENSQNLSYCFTLFSEKYPERTERAASFHYYRCLRKKYKNDPQNSKFILGDRKKLMPMTKNVARNKKVEGVYITVDKIKRIVAFIMESLN